MYRSILIFLAVAQQVSSKPIETDPRHPEGCSDTSFGDFEWTVEDFDYHASYIFTTPAHQNSWGYVNFNLSNPAVPDLLASCSAASNQLSDFFYGTFEYNCTLNGELGNPGPAPARFTFSRPSGELALEQSWRCDDNDPKYPTTFSASGQANLTLDCTDTTWQNANWTLGQFYSTRNVNCALVTVDVTPSKISAVA